MFDKDKIYSNIVERVSTHNSYSHYYLLLVLFTITTTRTNFHDVRIYKSDQICTYYNGLWMISV